jgi:hypothetical protein
VPTIERIIASVFAILFEVIASIFSAVLLRFSVLGALGLVLIGAGLFVFGRLQRRAAPAPRSYERRALATRSSRDRRVDEG